MMNTILNIGLNDEVVEGMIKLTGNPRFVCDSYRRLVEMFGTTVFNLDDEVFEHPMAEYKAKKGYKLDTEMTAEDWKALVADLQRVFTSSMPAWNSRRKFTSKWNWPPRLCSNPGRARKP